MYIDYSNLWRLLAEKGISKTDLMQLTGLSSRIIAKLAKNETVTTETIAKICEALSCNVGDIMSCTDENTMSLYQCFRAHSAGNSFLPHGLCQQRRPRRRESGS